jgi:hypothetical protein
MQQQPGQDVASFAADVLKAARGLEMTQAQLVRLVLGCLHAKVTPFVEMSQPQTVEELLCCPAAAKGMTAPAMERDVMACTTHSIELTGHGSDRAEQVTTRDGEYAPGQLGRQRYGGSAGYEGDRAEREAPRVIARDGGYGSGRRGQQQFIPEERGYYGRDLRSAARMTRDRGQGRNYRDERCAHCGRWCEGDRNCPAFGKRCYGCQQIGHFMVTCPDRNNRR